MPTKLDHYDPTGNLWEARHVASEIYSPALRKLRAATRAAQIAAVAARQDLHDRQVIAIAAEEARHVAIMAGLQTKLQRALKTIDQRALEKLDPLVQTLDRARAKLEKADADLVAAGYAYTTLYPGRDPSDPVEFDFSTYFHTHDCKCPDCEKARYEDDDLDPT